MCLFVCIGHRERHIGLPKAQIAAQEVVTMNPALKGRVQGLLHKLGEETEHLFNTAFWENTDVVVTALVSC